MRYLRCQPRPGELFRYLVRSESDPAMEYLVDLTERSGYGVCSCIYFQAVAHPNFARRQGEAVTKAARKGLKASDEETAREAYIPYAKGRAGATECKHIKIARAHLEKYHTIPLLASFQLGWPKKIKEVLTLFFTWPS